MWHLNTQVKDGILAVYINVFEPRMGKRRRFINFMVYPMVYSSIAIKHVTLDTISPWYEYVCTHTCSHFLRKPLLR